MSHGLLCSLWASHMRYAPPISAIAAATKRASERAVIGVGVARDAVVARASPLARAAWFAAVSICRPGEHLGDDRQSLRGPGHIEHEDTVSAGDLQVQKRAAVGL